MVMDRMKKTAKSEEPTDGRKTLNMPLYVYDKKNIIRP